MHLRAVCLVVVCGVGVGCARPYSGPKTLAAIGASLVVGGGTMWVAGERTDRPSLVTTGFVGTLIGVGAVIAAGGWMARSIECDADPDCPVGEECRELPTLPGNVPYKQCIKR